MADSLVACVDLKHFLVEKMVPGSIHSTADRFEQTVSGAIINHVITIITLKYLRFISFTQLLSLLFFCAHDTDVVTITGDVVPN